VSEGGLGKCCENGLVDCSLFPVLCRCRCILQVTDYFSYEHFYVIYCKFWELDTDHDLEIDAQDLLRHGDFGEQLGLQVPSLYLNLEKKSLFLW